MEIYMIEFQFENREWRLGRQFSTDRSKLEEQVAADNVFDRNTGWPRQQRVRAFRIEPVDGLPSPTLAP